MRFLTFFFPFFFFLSFFHSCSLSLPSMHAIYISRFSFTIAISRRHIIKSRLACNIKRMDLLSSGSTYDNNIFVISFTFGFYIYRQPTTRSTGFFFHPGLYPFYLPTSSFLFPRLGFHISINTITSLIFFHRIFNDHSLCL